MSALFIAQQETASSSGGASTGQPPGIDQESPPPPWSVKFFRKDVWQHAPAIALDLMKTGKIRVEYSNGKDGTPWMSMETEVLDALAALWKCSIVVKLLGRMISHVTLRNVSA